MRSLYAVLIALLLACITMSVASLDARTSSEKVILTTATGEQKEVTREELAAMQRAQQGLQEQLQDTSETDWVEDEDMDDLKRRNPALARSIHLARESFDVLKHHGYAQGYALASFTEVDSVPITSKKAQAEGAKVELRVTMQIRAQFDPRLGIKANPGTSATKRAAEPEKLSYEVEVLFDQDEVVSVVFAWQLRSDDTRGKELTIKPSDALQKRFAERRQRKQQEREGGLVSFVAPHASWLLAGGVTLIVMGVAMVFLASREPPEAANARAAIAVAAAAAQEATATSPRKAKKKTIVEREAGPNWELAE